MKVLLCCLSLLLVIDQAVSEGTIYPCPPFGLSRLPHSTSCDRYVQCIHGVAVVRECAANLHYNIDEQECMDRTLAKCTHDANDCPLYNDPTNLVYHQETVGCGKYYLCYNNKMHEYNCADGLHWDAVNQRCAYPNDAECENYTIECPADGIVNVPHPYICNRFYTCVQRVPFPSQCPADLLFDITYLTCNRPEDSTCFSEGSVTTTTPVVTTTSTTEETTTTSTTTTETTTTSTTTTTTEAPPVFECNSTDFGVFAHPTNGCTWYIVCENGVPKEGECPLYTFYTDRLAICQFGICSNEN